MGIYALDGEAPELPADGLYWVAETAAVIGRVRLHSDVSVWWGSVLRGDNEWIEIGARSQVQDNATSAYRPGFALLIGKRLRHRHKRHAAWLQRRRRKPDRHGSHHAERGEDRRQLLWSGAGALITEGKEFPDNSVIVGRRQGACARRRQDAAP
jgi:carbonic anhydrase/acetyltransferase-like protein (isoleucine patch superfamily)